MRYLARRYGEYFQFKIPDIIPIDKVPIQSQTIFDRRQSVYQDDHVVAINRINRLNTRDFVRTVTETRLKYPDKLLYLPFFGLPNDYPVLFYLGIDLLDDSPIRLLGNNNCVTEFGTVKDDGCQEKNIVEARRVMELIELSLKNDRFRELVESHSFSNFSKEALRIVDMEYGAFTEHFMDIRPKKIIASNVEGLYRPEIVDFRRRISQLIQTADNLLLIPCSATKPYSFSKTHRILHSLIARHMSGIQEVIVTSPLGLVPRELEAFFPSMYYDIPVTGHWFDEEKRILDQTASSFFEGKKYENVFYVLPKQERGILRLFNDPHGVDGNLNYFNSEKLAGILEESGLKGDWKKKERAEFSNVIKYNWNLVVNPNDISVKNEGNRRVVSVLNSEYLVKTRAGVRMLKSLGQDLEKEGRRTVEIDGLFKGSNIFIPGIKQVSQDIKPGMEVAIVRDGEVVGRGIAQISDFDLLFEMKGIGVSEVSYF